jgi:hypothetical protein
MCLQPMRPEQAVLDHDHKSGFLRAVLCRNCNGIEGKIKSLAARGKRQYDEPWFLTRLLAYWEQHNDATPDHGLLHPTHKTADEQRERTNKLARLRRAAAKEKHND